MATDTSKTSQTRSRDFIVRQIGKFWILKTHDKTKRLVFLDNAQYVQIEENILIADDQLFEIHEDERGDISFRKVEDLSYVGMDRDGGQQRENYYCPREEAATNVTTEGNVSVKHESDTQNLNAIKQTDSDYKNTIRADILREYEEPTCAVKQKQQIYTGSDEVICGVKEGSDTYRGSDNSVYGVKQDPHIYSGSDEVIYSIEEGSDIYRGSDDSVCGAAKEQETTDPTAKDYVNIDGYIPKATQETSSNTSSKSFIAEFKVDVESSDLAKKCGIEGSAETSVIKGQKGDQGEHGSSGIPGTPGTKGPRVSQGLYGLSGLPGLPGSKGERGNLGLPGQKGERGNLGPLGWKGERGYVGLPGRKGEKGTRGIPGMNVENGNQGQPEPRSEPDRHDLLPPLPRLSYPYLLEPPFR